MNQTYYFMVIQKLITPIFFIFDYSGNYPLFRKKYVGRVSHSYSYYHSFFSHIHIYFIKIIINEKIEILITCQI